MSSDLDPSKNTVKGHGSGYFSSFCTNEASTKRVYVQGATSPSNGGHLYPIKFESTDKPRLLDLNLSPANNHVGISTLAITSDRHIVVWQQGDLNIQDPGKVVATGSGSANESDWVEDSLTETILLAMERELKEEALKHGVELDIDEIAETKILGFFRWLGRGGKPEFIGLSRLLVSAEYLIPDHVEVFNVTDSKTRDRLNNIIFLPDLQSLPNVLEEIHNFKHHGAYLNLPLKFILKRLGDLRARDSDTLQNFLYA